MKKIFIMFLFCGILTAQNAAAKRYQKVDHCDYNEDTRVEICYGEDGKLLRGWAVVGNQPKSAAAQRREMRKSAKRGAWVIDGPRGEVYAEGGQPYTLSKYRDGKKDGLSRDIDYRGFAVKRVQYKDGVKHGSYAEYYMDNHKRKVEATYKKGLLEGRALFFNDRGQKIGSAKYKNGKLINGYCKHSKGDKEVFNSQYVKSFPENELVKCQQYEKD